MNHVSQVRTYDPAASVVFLKTNERFGGLSNMAPGFPLQVNGVRIRTSEALYQSCRFPHMPEVQRKIIDERSPMTAKMRSKPFRKESRPDWDAVRVKVMRWCLRVKLAQNWSEFGTLLLETTDRPIVEQSRKDDFWGAMVAEDGLLVGMNVLGRLLMELREQLKGDEAESLRSIGPLAIPDFLLFQRPIQIISAEGCASLPDENKLQPSRPIRRDPPQPSLFEQPMLVMGLVADIQNSTIVAAQSDQKLKPYSGYRDSGLPWFGRIPEHWEVRRNGRLFAERNQTGFEDLPILEVSLRTGVRVRDMVDGARKQQMTDRSKYKRAEKGDIAYNMMRMWQGAVGVAPVDGLISPAYVVARPFPEVETRYYAYLFRTDAYKREVNKFSRGIVSDRNRLYWDEFKQIPSTFPPMVEQSRISDFLDAHGGLTAQLIRNKRKLIGLLNEQKQAVINRAVTRGLNPNVPMKLTGIEWMPEIPAHWEVRPIKTLARRGYKTFVDGDWIESPYIADSGIRLIQTGNIGRGHFKEQGFRYISEQTFHRFNCTEFAPGEILICRLGDPVSRACLAPDLGVRMVTSVDVCILKPGPAFCPQLVVNILNCRGYLDWVNSLVRGSTRDRVSRSMLGSFRIPISPDASEQNEIVASIHVDTKDLDKTIERISSEIALIREYRERLVSDVVTGKLDVRCIEIAAPADEPISGGDDAMDEELEGDDAELTEGADADDRH